MKTLKISELIKILEAYRKELGDIPVFHQKDPEGNEFGTIDLRSISYDTDTKVGTAMFIYPFEENIDDKLFEWNAPWEE